MYIEIHNALGKPQRIEVTRVVTYDRFGNPIALAVEVMPDTIEAETLRNPGEFHELLRSLGITKTVVVTDVPQLDLRQVRFDNP